MAKKAKPKYVNCRYPKCRELHESTEILKSEAIKHGKGYYHDDCLHTMLKVTEIRDLFYKEVNPLMTGKQIGELVSIVNHLIFKKDIKPDFILFALQYYIKYKPGSLNYPGGIAYIVQNKDVIAAWKKEQERLAKEEIRKQQKETVVEDDEFRLDLPENQLDNNTNKKSKFSRVLGV